MRLEFQKNSLRLETVFTNNIQMNQLATNKEGVILFKIIKHTLSQRAWHEICSVVISEKNLFKDSLKTEPKVARRMEKRLKAIILRYNRDLIRPQTKVYEKNNTLHN